MTADTSDGARPSIPSPIPAISDAVVDAALTELVKVIPRSVLDVFPRGVRKAVRCALSAAIAADREASRAEIERLKETAQAHVSGWVAQSERASKAVKELHDAHLDIGRLTKERDEAKANELEALNELDSIYGVLGTADQEGGDPAAHTIGEMQLEIERLHHELDAALSSLSIAEQATRTALESIPIAMTAAQEKEREACAKIVDDEASAMLSQREEIMETGTLGGRRLPDNMRKDISRERRILAEGYESLAAAIRNRGEAK